MREQVERLKHHADFAPHFVDALDVGRELDAVDADRPALMLLEPVNAADQGRLARSRGAANHDALAAPDGEVDVAQHMERAEPLVYAQHLDRRVRRRHRACPVD